MVHFSQYTKKPENLQIQTQNGTLANESRNQELLINATKQLNGNHSSHHHNQILNGRKRKLNSNENQHPNSRHANNGIVTTSHNMNNSVNNVNTLSRVKMEPANG